MAPDDTPEIAPEPPEIGGPAAGTALTLAGRRVDGRRAEAKRYKEICGALAHDLGGDPSTAQKVLIQRAASLTVQCEMLDVNLIEGREVDIDALVKLNNALNRTLGLLGLQRRARDIGGSVVVDSHTAFLQGGDDEPV